MSLRMVQQRPSVVLASLVMAVFTLLEWTVRADVVWTQVGAGGFGDPGNKTALAMRVFDGYLYAATENHAGSQVWKLRLETSTWRNVTPGWRPAPARVEAPAPGQVEAMAVYRGSLYMGTDTGEIWRTAGEFRPCIPVPFAPTCVPGPTPSELWSKVVVGPFGWVPTPIGSMVVFGDALYLAKAGSSGLEIWRTNGSEWRRVVTNGFGDAINNQFAKLAVYNDQIYAGTARTMPGGTGPVYDGLEVWRSRDGLTWGAVVATGEPGALMPSGFGDRDNAVVTDLVVFRGLLYLTTVSTCSDVWRFDGRAWEAVTPIDYTVVPCRGPRLQRLAVFANRIFVSEGIRLNDAGVYISVAGRTWSGDRFPGIGPSVDAMEASPRHLYVALRSEKTGVQIWRRAGPSVDFCLIRPELCGIF